MTNPTMRTNALSIAILGLSLSLSVFVVGCWRPSTRNDYIQTVQKGITNVPHVQEIKQRFPGAPIDHFITHYGFNRSEPVMWNTEVFVANKYMFTYQVYVVVDYKNHRILKIVGEPKFYLHEVTNVFGSFETNIGADFGYYTNLAEKDWNRIYKAQGDFSVIGINLITNAPVRRFEDFVTAIRRDRIQVE